jgi:hypothetical protein
LWEDQNETNCRIKMGIMGWQYGQSEKSRYHGRWFKSRIELCGSATRAALDLKVEPYGPTASVRLAPRLFLFWARLINLDSKAINFQGLGPSI